MVLYKLHTGIEISRVELIRDIPAQRAKLSAFLHNRVQEGHGVEHGPPLGHVGDIQEVLGDTGVGSLQACPHALRRLIGELDRHL